MADSGGGVDPKQAELAALVNGIRESVRRRHANEAVAAGVEVELPNLLPILHARDAAFAKAAAIGRVNPRAGGTLNRFIQSGKRLISRSLGWFVRDQVEFNRAAVASTEAIMAALQENNRVLRELAARIPDVPAMIGPIGRDVQDMRSHWIAWRSEWERRLSVTETQYLRGLADLQGAFHHRATLIEAHSRELAASQHREFEGALERANAELQRRFWTDLERIRLEYESLIHNELRVTRQRAGLLAAVPPPPVAGVGAAGAAPAAPASYTELFDTWKFADKFRGPEEYVRKNHEFYLPYFKGCKRVVDLGCGRGEFLALLAEHGIAAQGIEYSEELTAYCRRASLNVERAEMFEFLGRAPEHSFDGIFCAQVVEHLDPARLPELIRLAHSRLAPGGVFIVETPNPECLAIFATHFYLDPTHTRPIPPALLAFYFEEFGFGQLETRRFAPATEATPALASLPEDVRSALFGAQDYAVIGKRLR